MSDENPDKAAPEDRATAGPFDDAEANPVRPYIDLGGIKVLPREGLNLRLEVEEQTKRIVAVGLDYAESTLQVQPFAAPARAACGTRPASRSASRSASRAAASKSVRGRSAPNFSRRCPSRRARTRHRASASHDSSASTARAGSCAEDRGAATNDVDAAAKVEDLFRSIVVVRGGTPMPRATSSR